MERLLLRWYIVNSGRPSYGFALCAWFLSAQLDIRGHNRALGGAGTVQSKQPTGAMDPELDGFHGPVL